MPRVVGIDPGTFSIDLCGLDDGRVFLDRSIPTREALADPAALVSLLEESAPLDLVAAPSGYGLPVAEVRSLGEEEIRLACLSARGDEGGIGGLGALLRAIASSSLRAVVTPGVVHLPSVPDHRKVNRVDMGTADKVCAVALALHERSHGGDSADEAFILLELGGAFTAAIAVEGGRIVDGLGGSSGPLGPTAPGALDGEVAFLAGEVTKRMLFEGGALAVAGVPAAPVESLARADSPAARTAWEAYVESVVKAVAALSVSAPRARLVLLSGRMSALPVVRETLAARLAPIGPGFVVEPLRGLARVAKHAAQGAALVADGLAGGHAAPIVRHLGIAEARGTVLDHLYVVSRLTARQRLGLV